MVLQQRQGRRAGGAAQHEQQHGVDAQHGHKGWHLEAADLRLATASDALSNLQARGGRPGEAVRASQRHCCAPVVVRARSSLRRPCRA
jgi:hypothetical protein